MRNGTTLIDNSQGHKLYAYLHIGNPMNLNQFKRHSPTHVLARGRGVISRELTVCRRLSNSLCTDSVRENVGFVCPWTRAAHQENRTCNNNGNEHDMLHSCYLKTPCCDDHLRLFFDAAVISIFLCIYWKESCVWMLLQILRMWTCRYAWSQLQLKMELSTPWQLKLLCNVTYNIYLSRIFY